MLMLPVCQNAFLHSVQLCGFSVMEYVFVRVKDLTFSNSDASSLSEYLFAFCATVWILSTVMEYVLIQTLSLSA